MNPCQSLVDYGNKKMLSMHHGDYQTKKIYLMIMVVNGRRKVTAPYIDQIFAFQH